MDRKFFFDTYALIEVDKGNPNYLPYKKDIKIILNKLNLLEYIYFLIRENRQEQIKGAVINLSRFNVDYDYV